MFSKFAAIDYQGNNIFQLIVNKFYLLSIVSLLIQSVFWQLTLRKIDLSVAYPLTAINNLFILILSYAIFNEEITFTNILGVSIIMIGIVVQNIKCEET
ncbi:EamA family transporter [Paenibacillus sp. MER 180]|uniref:EamA family transporter n=1 Tax=Paenibacillus sp. MER 180 TaxID=2939570 RepID=UPI0037C529A4